MLNFFDKSYQKTFLTRPVSVQSSRLMRAKLSLSISDKNKDEVTIMFQKIHLVWQL